MTLIEAVLLAALLASVAVNIVQAVRLRRAKRQERLTMAAIEDLTAQVTQNVSVEGSAVTLLNNIAAQIQAANGNAAQLEALANTLKTSATALAAAVAANTPAATPPPSP